MSPGARRDASSGGPTIFAATLPPACTTVVVDNVTLHQCGGTYYQPSGSQYVVVNVD